ncbi:MAG: hypothetical protein KC503_12695 [Myxococcales bacterium]|nr:hypothetical protein [Myxococcales bacterium]
MLVRIATLALALLLASLVLAGCPEKRRGDAPSPICTSAFQRCRLGNGPLGVCTPIPCKPGQKPPCLMCRPQH